KPRSAWLFSPNATRPRSGGSSTVAELVAHSDLASDRLVPVARPEGRELIDRFLSAFPVETADDFEADSVLLGDGRAEDRAQVPQIVVEFRAPVIEQHSERTLLIREGCEVAPEHAER